MFPDLPHQALALNPDFRGAQAAGECRQAACAPQNYRDIFPARGRFTSSPPQFGHTFCIWPRSSDKMCIHRCRCRLQPRESDCSRIFHNNLSFPAPFQFVLLTAKLIMRRASPNAIDSCTPATPSSSRHRAKRSSRQPPISSFGQKSSRIIVTSVISNKA